VGPAGPRRHAAGGRGQLNAEVNKLITAPELKEYFLKEGATVQPSTPAQFAATIAADIVRWKQVAARQSIKPE
jgi:tripartite-type tricarboxylate transporter receptor subunit TctC